MGLESLRVGVGGSRPAIFAIPLFLKEWSGGWRDCLITLQHLPYLQTVYKGEKDEREKNKRERRRGPGEVNALL